MTNAAELLDKLARAGVVLSITSNQSLGIKAPKNIVDDAMREKLRQHKVALLDLLKQRTAPHEKDETNELSFPKIPIPAKCPLCKIGLTRDDNAALVVRFCQFCNFTFTAFNNWNAVYDRAKQMFEAQTAADLEQMQFALSERAAIFMLENGFDAETAQRAAEADVLPPLLDKFARQQKTAN